MIKTEIYFVAYIDILGFSEFIRKYDEGLLPNLLLDLKDALGNAIGFLRISPNQSNILIENIKVHLFSDCLCAALPINLNFNDTFNNFVFFSLYISSYMNILMEKGFFARGGISIGSFYSDDIMIFSGALVDSVNLEKRAVYPRVLIDIKLVKKIESLADKVEDVITEIFVKDRDGLVFLNNFNIVNCTNIMTENNLKKLKSEYPRLIEEMKYPDNIEVQENLKTRKIIKCNIIRELMLNQSEEKIYAKYLWLKEYYDWSENKGFNKLKFEKYACKQ